MELILDPFLNILSQFTNPKKRVFIVYLLVSILIALVWLYFYKKKSFINSLKYIFNPKLFLSKSAKSDYKIFLINQTIMFFISPILITQLTIATALYYYFHTISWLSSGMFSYFPIYLVVTLFTIFHFVLDDFTKFLIHRWMHKWHFLWALHKVHHSATNLTPMTVFRTHPLEGIVFSLRAVFTQAITLSLFIFLFGNKVDLITILGANVFIFLFNILGSNLRHSHIGIRYWRWLEYILISPAQHHLHHSISKDHHDKNFGVSLAIWDWFFGSLHHSEEAEKLTLGISKKSNENTHTLKNLYFGPIKEILSISVIKFNKLFNFYKSIFKKIKYLFTKPNSKNFY
ncbi:MAG: sterol desaturase [Pelagibacteraceae bacterium]|nr:sterol desaturase [Pelagibacteraceae bacterium]|tara:strand:+ start:2767 stop:3798 length:1032 start_codon:yes stop_codon:yes gene_type:complete